MYKNRENKEKSDQILFFFMARQAVHPELDLDLFG